MMILWLTAMNYYHAAQGKPEQFTPEEESSFEMADNLFRGAVISALDAKYIDSYITHTLLQRSCGMHWMLNLVFLMLGSELYLMKQLFDYKMVEDRSVVEQAHEVQSLAK
jgi:short subunit fatty acids transporter